MNDDPEMFRNIVLLKMTNEKEEAYWGTGLIISKNLVLTCAHNLFDK